MMNKTFKIYNKHQTTYGKEGEDAVKMETKQEND